MDTRKFLRGKKESEAYVRSLCSKAMPTAGFAYAPVSSLELEGKGAEVIARRLRFSSLDWVGAMPTAASYATMANRPG